jgi:hypothetical protein
MLPTLFVIIIIRSIFQHYAEAMAIRSPISSASLFRFLSVAYLIAVVSRRTVNISREAKTASRLTYQRGLKYILDEKTLAATLKKRKRR